MVRIHNESSFKLQIYFPNLGDTPLHPFVFKYYTKEGQCWTVSYNGVTYQNCTLCPGGVLAYFQYDNQELKKFEIGQLMVDMAFDIPDGDRTMHITNTLTTGIEIVKQDATFAFDPIHQPEAKIPIYNSIDSPYYPVHVVVYPKGEKGDPAPIYNPALLTEYVCEREFCLNPDGSESQLHTQSFLIRFRSYKPAGWLFESLFGGFYHRLFHHQGYASNPASYFPMSELLPIINFANRDGALTVELSRPVSESEIWFINLKYTKL